MVPNAGHDVYDQIDHLEVRVHVTRLFNTVWGSLVGYHSLRRKVRIFNGDLFRSRQTRTSWIDRTLDLARRRD